MSTARRLLLPLVPAYRLALAARELRLRTGLERVRSLHWPVVSVGSLSAGGAGKTPFTIALARLLCERGFAVDVLSRGYGRVGSEAARVPLDGTAAEFGDEPLLIARNACVPVFVAAHRYDAGKLAEADTAHRRAKKAQRSVHLLDDGFQHRRLARDVDILLVDRRDWHDRLLPAGNLREPHNTIRRASVIAIPADEPELASELQKWSWNGPVWRVRRSIEVPAVAGPVAAFCGIARPKQFFRSLEAAGMRLALRAPFPDHHWYTERDIERLLARARAAGATALVTTEKDEVRLGRLTADLVRDLPLITAVLRIEIEREEEVTDWLASRLAEALARRAV
jgi:tetraacyldisaccharide 4'-kinase